MSSAPARESFDAVVIGARCAGSARRSPSPCGPQRARGRPLAVPVRHALDAPQLPLVGRRDAAPRRAAADPAIGRARSAARAWSRPTAPTASAVPADRGDRLRALQPAPGVRPGARRDGPRRRRRGARANRARRRAVVGRPRERRAAARAADGRGVRGRLLARDRRRRPRVDDRQRVGAAQPYRGSRNGRGLAFFYCDDPQVGTAWRGRVIQLRAGTTHTLSSRARRTGCSCCSWGRPRRSRCSARTRTAMLRTDARREPGGRRARRRCAEPDEDPRSTGSVAAFFRRSSGPGWALAGDAGHFKDPVIGQGMRDAMRFGRLLGEAAAPVLDDPARLDRDAARGRARPRPRMHGRATTGATASRGSCPSRRCCRRRCAIPPQPSAAPDGHVRSRARAAPRPQSAARRQAGAEDGAARRGTDRRALLREVREELRIDADIWREELTRPVPPDARLGVGAAGLRGSRRRPPRRSRPPGGAATPDPLERDGGRPRRARHRGLT